MKPERGTEASSSCFNSAILKCSAALCWPYCGIAAGKCAGRGRGDEGDVGDGVGGAGERGRRDGDPNP